MKNRKEGTELVIKCVFVMYAMAALLFLTAGCSGVQRTSQDSVAKAELTAKGNGQINHSTAQIQHSTQKKAQVDQVKGDVESIKSTTNTGIQPWMFILGSLLVGMLIPRPKIIRALF